MSVATIDPGQANLIMDHLQLALRHGADEAPGPVTPPDPHFYLSLYVIPWSREMGAGHVALVRHHGEGGAGGQGGAGGRGEAGDMILTDNLALARAQQAILRSVGYSRIDLTAEPRPASFVRNPLRQQDRVRYLISAPDLEIEARWDDLGEAIFAYGPAPQKPDRQRIWSVLFEAAAGSALVNGVPIAGRTYAMESWVPWLGRSLHSAHVARGEILVDNPTT